MLGALTALVTAVALVAGSAPPAAASWWAWDTYDLGTSAVNVSSTTGSSLSFDVAARINAAGYNPTPDSEYTGTLTVRNDTTHTVSFSSLLPTGASSVQTGYAPTDYDLVLTDWYRFAFSVTAPGLATAVSVANTGVASFPGASITTTAGSPAWRSAGGGVAALGQTVTLAPGQSASVSYNFTLSFEADNRTINTTTLAAFSIPLTSAYGVTYSATGSTGSVPVDATAYTAGATATVLFAPLPTKTGSTFTGWTSASDGSGDLYTSSGTTTLTMPAANVTLYAQWLATSLAVPDTSATVSAPGTVHVTVTNAVAGGTVRVTVGGLVLSPTLVGNVAAVLVPSLAAGTYTVTTDYLVGGSVWATQSSAYVVDADPTLPPTTSTPSTTAGTTTSPSAGTATTASATTSGNVTVITGASSGTQNSAMVVLGIALLGAAAGGLVLLARRRA